MNSARTTPGRPSRGGLVATARRIVVGYDGSDGARLALERTAELAGYGSRVTVVHVVRRASPRTAGTLSDPPTTDRGRRLLEEAARQLAARDVVAGRLERVGDPGAELVEVARELEADLVVVGEGKSGLERIFLGSVSTQVVHRAPCDVLVVRGGRQDEVQRTEAAREKRWLW
jgi:nucleotide-binding universal stress UspA family protein